jgi:hypothetical protein
MSAHRKSAHPQASDHLEHATINPISENSALPKIYEASPTPVTFAEAALGHDFSRVPLHAEVPVQRTPSCSLSPTRCPFGGACHTCSVPVQTKLKIGQPDDKYEREADRIADMVMSMPEPRVQRQVGPEAEEEDETVQTKPLTAQITPLVQRQVEPEEEEEQEKLIQAKLTKDAWLQRQEEEVEEEEEQEPIQAKQAEGQVPQIGRGLEARVRSLRDGGRPLSPSVRSFFEPRFGHDFSQVQVHTGVQAAQSAQLANARAFTLGRDIVFGSGQYVPETETGQRLLAHELTHVIQQNVKMHTAASSRRGGSQNQVAEGGVRRIWRASRPAKRVAFAWPRDSQVLQRKKPSHRTSLCRVSVCFLPIRQYGLGSLGFVHGVINVRGRRGRWRHLEVDPSRHKAGGQLHSHVRILSGRKASKKYCQIIKTTCKQGSSILAAARKYESRDVTYDPVSGPNSNSFIEWTLNQAGIDTSKLSVPSLAVGWGYYIGNASKRSAPPRVARSVGCKEPVRKARNFTQYIRLLRKAELALIDCGIGKKVDDRIKILSEIYYGTTWSTDYAAEKSETRNLGFQIFTQRPRTLPGPGPDPRPCLGCGLFLSLRGSQDVRGVDMGHVMIGLSARASSSAREGPASVMGVPVAASVTGLEIVTWVGDLGGASARLALDRVSKPKAGLKKYFRGTDYGAPSNLEGDVSAYVAASEPSTKTTVGPLVLPASGLIADALKAHFAVKGGRRNRCYRFLLMQGAKFSGRTLENRSAVEAAMAVKLFSFGSLYMVNFLRQRHRLDWSLVGKARSRLFKASLDVAHRFVTWLLSCLPKRMPKAGP